MCGRYVLWTPEEELTAIFGTDFRIGEVTPTYNAAPSQQLPIVFERYEEEPGGCYDACKPTSGGWCPPGRATPAVP